MALSTSKNSTEIALIGKYVELKDSYISIAESLIHAGAENKTRVNIHWIHSSEMEGENIKNQLWPNITYDLNYLSNLNRNLLIKTSSIFDTWIKKNISIKKTI